MPDQYKSGPFLKEEEEEGEEEEEEEEKLEERSTGVSSGHGGREGQQAHSQQQVMCLQAMAGGQAGGSR